MRKILFIIAIFLILIVSNFIVNSSDNKISEKVYESLKDGKIVNVMIKIKEPVQETGVLIRKRKSASQIGLEKDQRKEKIIETIGNKKVKHVFDDVVAAEVSEEDLIELNKNPDVESVVIDKPIKAYLQDSVPYLNASEVWEIQISGINVTGIDETVCVLDTGINFSHPSLIGKNKTCIIDCDDQSCVEDCSVHDDNGHGTHVAGIVAASGEINGVAIGADLIGVKVLDLNGNGGESNLIAGVNWCINNSKAYNISVITMSLGDCSNHNTYCNSDTLTPDVNNATGNNISIIVAAGNGPPNCPLTTNTDGPSWPACIENVTAIGAVNDTNNAISYQRGALFELFAPGISINSTVPTGGCELCAPLGYNILSGTSMAAPHAAGVFALMQHFSKLQDGRTLEPSEIKLALNNSGPLLDDSGGSGYVFTRIDSLSGLYALDSLAPNVTLISPTNNTIDSSNNQTFSCNVTDNLQLKNITLEIWDNVGDLYYNVSNETSGNFLELEFNVSLSEGNYDWNCIAYDQGENGAYASSNFSLFIGNVSVTLSSPVNNTFTNQNQTNFTCPSQTSSVYELTNISFFIWNATDLVNSSYLDISGISNSTTFQYNFTEEAEYEWNCIAYNNETQFSVNENSTITYDISNPVISDMGSSVSTTSATITWTTNKTANSSVEYGTATDLGTTSSNSDLTTSHSIALSSLSSSTTYYYNVTSCDQAGNCVINGTYDFTTSAPAADPVSSGGGGGVSTTSSNTYTLTASQASSGYTQELEEDDKIKFVFFDKKSVQHTLTLDDVGNNFVKLTIRSDPIELTLGIGQSAKLNLTSSNYYDLYIKLNSIDNKKAKLTIQTINEEVPQTPITGDVIQDEIGDGEKQITTMDNGKEKDNLKNILIIVLIVIVLALIFVITLKQVNKKSEAKTKIQEYKSNFEKIIKPKKPSKTQIK